MFFFIIAGWCIYPAYDFTHGLCDSIEHIDWSICTLEFETRREPYYWILWALDVFRPKVYEMSRLNLQYTVLSKRRLIKLVTANYVRGWNDPRMPTVSGLRRRGYTKDIVNTFCNDVGATRSQNVVEISKLHQTARLLLSTTSRRVMAALEPILVTITNFEEEAAAKGGNMSFDVDNSPTDPSMGSHKVTMTPTMYIDASDFRLVDSPDYFALAPNKAVGLKCHGGNLVCDEVVKDGEKIKELKCHLDSSESRPKPKSFISWVPADGIRAEVRLYNELFTVPEPTDLWEDELNPESEIVHDNAIIDPSIVEVPGVDKSLVDQWKSNTVVQFERMGYFVVDIDTTFDVKSKEGKLVFNRTVSLKAEGPKAVKSAKELEANAARKAKNQRDLELKAARMKIEPNDLFRLAEEYKGKYSKFDEKTGVPTHDADGTELTKSAMKKLAKEKQKHEKALAAWKKNQK